MTFVRKYSGDRTKPIIAVYTCPEHGEHDATVERDENGEAPDITPCRVVTREVAARETPDEKWPVYCCKPATWTPSPVAGRVRLVEVVRGKWEKPEHKTYLDTRELGEGQDPEEFQAKRDAIWDEERRKTIKDELL